MSLRRSFSPEVRRRLEISTLLVSLLLVCISAADAVGQPLRLVELVALIAGAFGAGASTAGLIAARRGRRREPS